MVLTLIVEALPSAGFGRSVEAPNVRSASSPGLLQEFWPYATIVLAFYKTSLLLEFLYNPYIIPASF